MSLINNYIKLVLLELQEQLDPVHATAQYAHLGQKRRSSGKPYVTHPENVANIIKKYYPGNSKIYFAALLHDSLEDAIDQGNVDDEEEMIALIYDSIEDEDMAGDVVDIVMSLTKLPGSDYSDYLISLSSDPEALIVKMADMLDNISDNPSPRQREKYSKAIKTLEDSFGGMPDFINPQHWREIKKAISDV
tara:strand:+ start:402 stop:974 length:573 start_codon:yes stop_codon:yes gene_type:complete